MTTTRNRSMHRLLRGGLRASALVLALSVPAIAQDDAASEKTVAPDKAAAPAKAAVTKEKPTPAGQGTKAAVPADSNKLKAKQAGSDNNATVAGSQRDMAPGARNRPGQDEGDDSDKNRMNRGIPQGRALGRPHQMDRSAALEAYKQALHALAQAEAEGDVEGDSKGDAGASEDKDAKVTHQAALRAMRKARRDLRSAHMEHAREFLENNEENLEKLRADLRARAEKRRTDRKDRTDKHIEEIKKEWGEKVELEAVRAELAAHAWRVARLERLLAIAETVGKKEAAERAKELLEKEKEAHPDRLKEASMKPDKPPAHGKTVGAAGAAKPKPAAGTPATKPTTAAQPKAPAKPTTPAPAKTEGGAQ